MDNFAHGPDAIYFVQVHPDTLFIDIMYGTKDGVPMQPNHIRVPANIVWDYNAQQLKAVRDPTTGAISIVLA